MKFLIGVILGVLVGYQIGRMATGTSGSDLAARGRRITGGATRFGQSAIQRAKTTIQSRLAGDGEGF
jgi:hypothetical protein